MFIYRNTNGTRRAVSSGHRFFLFAHPLNLIGFWSNHLTPPATASYLRSIERLHTRGKQRLFAAPTVHAAKCKANRLRGANQLGTIGSRTRGLNSPHQSSADVCGCRLSHVSPQTKTIGGKRWHWPRCPFSSSKSLSVFSVCSMVFWAASLIAITSSLSDCILPGIQFSSQNRQSSHRSSLIRRTPFPLIVGGTSTGANRFYQLLLQFDAAVAGAVENVKLAVMKDVMKNGHYPAPFRR